MQQNVTHRFTATPDGILVGGRSLTKATSLNLSTQTMRYVKRAEELLATVKKADWDNCTPQAPNDVTTLAKAQMMSALASPQSFGKYSLEQPRDDHGRWTREGVTAADRKNPRFNGMGPVEIKKQKFVDAHLTAAEKGAKQLNVPVENLLALSAVESGWGRGGPAKGGNNFLVCIILHLLKPAPDRLAKTRMQGLPNSPAIPIPCSLLLQTTAILFRTFPIQSNLLQIYRTQENLA